MLNRKVALAMISVVIAISVIDSSIVKFIAYGNNEFPKNINVGIFIGFTVLYIAVVHVLKFLNRESDPSLKNSSTVKSSYLLITLTEYFLIGILTLIIIQMFVSFNYDSIFLQAVILVSHLAGISFLIFLIIIFLTWIRTKKNKLLSLYGISFSFIVLALIISLVYSTYVISDQPSIIRPYSIHHAVVSLPHSGLSNSFGTALDITTLVSFILFWIASASLFSTFSRRIGRIKYWIIIIMPLIYFVVPFETYFLNLFSPIVISSPVLFSIVNILIFSATKQIGALFFSLAFFSASALVPKTIVQKYLLISAIGMAALFGSLEIDSLLYATYPPFGLITISFIPVGSFLLFTGILASATFVSKDKTLRNEFYKTAMSQLSLLKTIGITQMENELIKNYKTIEKRANSLENPIEKESRLEKDDIRELLHNVLEELPKENVREILRDVLTELYAKRKEADR